MNIKTTLTALLLLIGTTTFAQEEAKAMALLNEVSAKLDSYKNIAIKFKYTLNNAEEDISQESNGFVTIQQNNYNLDFMGNTFICDGNYTYVIVPEDEEVSIFKEEPTDENTITPSKMLVFYKEGFTYQWDALKNISGRKVQFVKLFPKDSKSEIKHVLLGIDAKTKHIYKLIETGKNGTQTTLLVSDFKVNQALAENMFVFDRAAYLAKDYVIIDEE